LRFTVTISILESSYDISIDEAFVSIVTISPKFQVVIPRAIRDQLDLEPGQKVQAMAFGNRIEFIPLKPARALRGFLRGIDTTIAREPDRF
jgi:AbrB family looped-hinge helix DNA binding protein